MTRGWLRGWLAALSLAEVGAVTIAGGLIAVAIAVTASPLMPNGPAHHAGDRSPVAFPEVVLI